MALRWIVPPFVDCIQDAKSIRVVKTLRVFKLGRLLKVVKLFRYSSIITSLMARGCLHFRVSCSTTVNLNCNTAAFLAHRMPMVH
jgi:hypothetical protein